ncbi:hypothetical protein KIN20_020407 [Parelaphostrongylus tenuis]|uniref:Uncharacterized protein n=1 Tax=Parelaphostrongylus tenuis TaxID=148309 RepID=A0AAD5QTH6_PARTN|nr:hypothetical protein KIN20_020407 [Parelaphostrongylus tenuis]
MLAERNALERERRDMLAENPPFTSKSSFQSLAKVEQLDFRSGFHLEELENLGFASFQGIGAEKHPVDIRSGESVCILSAFHHFPTFCDYVVWITEVCEPLNLPSKLESDNS